MVWYLFPFYHLPLAGPRDPAVGGPSTPAICLLGGPRDPSQAHSVHQHLIAENCASFHSCSQILRDVGLRPHSGVKSSESEGGVRTVSWESWPARLCGFRWEPGLLEMWWGAGSGRLRLLWLPIWLVAERRPFCARIHYSSTLFAALSLRAMALLAPASLTPSCRDTSGPAQEGRRVEEAENREHTVPFWL